MGLIRKKRLLESSYPLTDGAIRAWVGELRAVATIMPPRWINVCDMHVILDPLRLACCTGMET